jgi:CheY-like chemotaxis protein
MRFVDPEEGCQTAKIKKAHQMLKVMIAEDDLLMADMLEDVLVQSGYEVCGIARTVEEGIELGDRCKPDLAILDIRLAEGGLGMDIAARMHSKDGIGILYASGNSSQVGLTKDDGAALLRKPYRPEDMVRALEIVEQIANTGEASRPFPKGFSVLNVPSPKSSALSDPTGDNDDGIRRLLRQQGALAEFGSYALGERLADVASPQSPRPDQRPGCKRSCCLVVFRGELYGGSRNGGSMSSGSPGSPWTSSFPCGCTWAAWATRRSRRSVA